MRPGALLGRIAALNYLNELRYRNPGIGREGVKKLPTLLAIEVVIDELPEGLAERVGLPIPIIKALARPACR
jgi:hypothetical protein